MRLLILSIFLIVQILGPKTCNAQGVGTFQWTNGAPTTNPGTSGARFAVDRATFRWYEWVSGTTWVESGDRIQRISGCSAPDYTPGKHQSHVVINGCTSPNIPEIYAWTGSAWVKLNPSVGATYTAGTGISITGTAPNFTINNTAPVEWPLIAPDSYDTPQYGFSDPNTGIYGAGGELYINADQLYISSSNGENPLAVNVLGGVGTSQGGNVIISGGTGIEYGGNLEFNAGFSTSNTAGSLTLNGGVSNLGDGGDLSLIAGNSNEARGGEFIMQGGIGKISGGGVTIAGGQSTQGNGGGFTLTGGQGTGIGGSFTLTGGVGNSGGGNLIAYAGGCDGMGNGGNMGFYAGYSNNGDGGNFIFVSGDSYDGGRGGDMLFQCGEGLTGGGSMTFRSGIIPITLDAPGIKVTPLTTSQINAITLTESQILYNSTTKTYEVFDGSSRYQYGKIIKASATLDFSSTAVNSNSDLTVTVTGAAVGDVVTVAPPLAAISAHSCFTAWVSAVNTVTVRFNHYGAGGATNPASGIFNIIVTKF